MLPRRICSVFFATKRARSITLYEEREKIIPRAAKVIEQAVCRSHATPTKLVSFRKSKILAQDTLVCAISNLIPCIFSNNNLKNGEKSLRKYRIISTLYPDVYQLKAWPQVPKEVTFKKAGGSQHMVNRKNPLAPENSLEEPPGESQLLAPTDNSPS